MTKVLILSALLFSIGLFGVIIRRNAIIILVSIEIMMNAAGLNFIGFSLLHQPRLVQGQVFAIVIIAIAACEAAVGLALVLAIYRRFRSTDVDGINLLRW
jgi:NAD(P)H-quinone oxidoreductase subunit 4L